MQLGDKQGLGQVLSHSRVRGDSCSPRVWKDILPFSSPCVKQEAKGEISCPSAMSSGTDRGRSRTWNLLLLK